jgi:hypothetical protein
MQTLTQDVRTKTRLNWNNLRFTLQKGLSVVNIMVPDGENPYFSNNYKRKKMFIVKAPVSVKEDMWSTS